MDKNIFDEMLETIEEMEAYAQAKGTMSGFDTGFQSLNKALDGLQTGLILVGGQSNIGKSAFAMQLAWQTAKYNQQIDEQHARKAYVMYFTLDDNAKDLLPRAIAIEQQIPINTVRNPAKYKGRAGEIALREKGLEVLRKSASYFKMLDAVAGTDIETIEAQIKRHVDFLREFDPLIRPVVFIDNFHDLTTTQNLYGEEENRYSYIAGQLTRIATVYDIPLVCTAEFRKLNGFRRPSNDDIRESTKTVYESKAMLLCYNEVGIRGQSANVFWNNPGAPDGNVKGPVFEVHVSKNKFDSFKGRLFFNFHPDRSFMDEADAEESRQYAMMMQ